jgi:hypothetical protein
MVKDYADSSIFFTNTAASLYANRMFLHVFEREMQIVLGNWNYRLPYWDSTIEFQNVSQSTIFKVFGGNGNCEREYVVDSGKFNNWLVFSPTLSLLKRRFDGRDGRIGPLFSQKYISYWIRSIDSYDKFRFKIENVASARVHLGIGGHMGSLDVFFNDPLAWLHRA